jgi:nucleoside-diphosphate-sugar epimerase
MRVLILGGAGFLGTECVRQFEANGHEVKTADLVGDVDYLGDLASKEFVSSLPDADVVVNCAAVQYVSKSLPLLCRERYFARNNVRSAELLAERYKDSGCHFIHVGTSMMYRQTGQALYGTGAEKMGDGVYSRSKLAAQQFIDEIPGAATVIPCIIGGKGREGLFIGFVTMICRRGMVAFPGSGAHKVHMVHVEDVARLILAISAKRASGLFNAAAPEPLSIREWVQEIQKELRIDKVQVISLPLAPIAFLSRILGYRLLAREQLLMLKYPHVLDISESLALGWKPERSNAKIVHDTARHIVDTRKLV